MSKRNRRVSVERGVGRPAKDAAEKRTNPVQIKLTDAEYEALAADAHLLHQPIAIYVRALVLDRTRPQPKT